MNGRRRFLTASVISVQNSSFVYPACRNCFSRLHLDSERYGCLKCGCSGDAGEASYRYRLSLEVADAHEVFLVTVFGSCLEAFFGVPAKSLQRYIEDLNSEAGEASGDTSPSVVIQAVEACFVGKKFIFGVKDSEKQHGAGRLQNDSRVGRCPKALTACQMFVPNPELVGGTVFHYLQQCQRSSYSEPGRGGVWCPGGLFAALDQPSSDVSGLLGSGDWDVVPSAHTDCLSNPWPQSFGLASSPVSKGAATDLTALSPSRTARNEPEWNVSPVSALHRYQSVNNSQDDGLTVNERNVQEDDKLCLCSTWRDSSFVTKDAQSRSSGGDDRRSLQSPLEKGSPGKMAIQCSRGLENSRNPVQGYSFCSLVSHTGHSGDGRSYQGDRGFWDELPSSESLNEFIARIEKGSAVALPAETSAPGPLASKRAGEICGLVHQSPLHLDAISASSQAHEKLQEVVEKGDGSKELVLSCYDPTKLSLISKGYKQEASFSYLSTQGKGEWEHLSSRHPNLSPRLSPAGLKPSGSKGSCLLSKERGDQDTAACEIHHPSSSLKTADECHKSPALLTCKCEGYVTEQRKKLRYSCELKHTSDLTNVQEPGFPSAACKKPDRVCERRPFQEVPKSNCKGCETNSFLQDSSICPQGGYNASADLFDTSTAGVDVAVGMFSTTQAFSAQGGVLTPKSAASGHKPSESEASWNISQSGLSFLDLFPDPKASSPVDGLVVKSGHSPLGAQDFVPSSQSTPRERPRQQATLPSRKKPILSEMPLNRLPWIGAKWKRPRPALKGPLVKRLVSKFLRSRRSSDMSSAATDTSTTLDFSSPARELSENNTEEWVPPSEKKRRQPHPFQNQKMFGSRRREITEKSRFSEKETRRKVPRGTVGLARTDFAPKSQQPTEAIVHEEGADPEQVMAVSPASCAFSDSSWSNLSSTPRFTPNAVNWSPELFGDNSRLLSPEATL